jgi:hypothetical protein
MANVLRVVTSVRKSYRSFPNNKEVAYDLYCVESTDRTGQMQIRNYFSIASYLSIFRHQKVSQNQRNTGNFQYLMGLKDKCDRMFGYHRLLTTLNHFFCHECQIISFINSLQYSFIALL